MNEYSININATSAEDLKKQIMDLAQVFLKEPIAKEESRPEPKEKINVDSVLKKLMAFAKESKDNQKILFDYIQAKNRKSVRDLSEDELAEIMVIVNEKTC